MSDKDTMTDSEKMREYFKNFIDVYVTTADKANLPADKEKLKEIMDTAEFQTFENHSTTGTFSVNRKLIRAIINNFKSNGVKRNNFLLFHEFTHLISPVNEELFADQNAFLQKLEEKAKTSPYPYVDEYNAYYGMIAIDEVLAQWCCEEHNDAYNQKKRETTEHLKGPLDANVKYTTSFSDNDIYSPLEQPVETLIKKLGYENLRDFATQILSQEYTSLVDRLDEKQFATLCQIGVICKGIYKENGFNNTITTTKEDVEKVYALINRNNDFGENPGSGDEPTR